MKDLEIAIKKAEIKAYLKAMTAIHEAFEKLMKKEFGNKIKDLKALLIKDQLEEYHQILKRKK